MARDSVILTDFSKGIDLISSLSNIQDGYTPAALNMRTVETGGVEKILGYAAFADLGSGVAGNEAFYYQNRAGTTKRLVVASATKWQAIQSDGTTMVDVVTGLTSSTNTTFAVYGDILYGLSRENNLTYTSTLGAGSTTTVAPGVSTGPPKGLILGIWSNRMFVASGTGTTVVWSDAGDMYSWPAANTATLGGTGAGSSNIVGGAVVPDGVLVFNGDSTYLIYDTDGANRLVDSEHGCSSRRSLSIVDGMVYGVNREGLFRTDGSAPLEIVSRNVDPLFTNENPTLSAAAGTWWKNSYLCSYNRTLGYNDFTLDFKPEAGSVMANQYRAACYAEGDIAATGVNLFFIDAGNTRYVRKAFSGGSFLTTASPGVASDIACFYETPPMDLGAESQLKRLHRIRLVGRGDLYVGSRVDYAGYNNLADRFSFPNISSAGVWNTALWDTGTWGGYNLYEGFVTLPARGRRIALRVYESSSNTFAVRQNIDIDPNGSLGGCAVYELEPQFTVSSRRR